MPRRGGCNSAPASRSNRAFARFENGGLIRRCGPGCRCILSPCSYLHGHAPGGPRAPMRPARSDISRRRCSPRLAPVSRTYSPSIPIITRPTTTWESSPRGNGSGAKPDRACSPPWGRSFPAEAHNTPAQVNRQEGDRVTARGHFEEDGLDAGWFPGPFFWRRNARDGAPRNG